jgi:hypothetical protein
MVNLATGAATEANPDEGKDPAAVSLGRRGGLKGGTARANLLTRVNVPLFQSPELAGEISASKG